MVSTAEEDAAVWQAVQATREYWAAGFGVPSEARESYTGAVVHAASAVIRQGASAQLRDAAAQRDAACEQLRQLRQVLANASWVMVTSATDWGSHAGEAWLYGIFVGWECDQPCEEFWDRAHRCDEGMQLMARRYGWSQERVARLRELRAAVRTVQS